MRLASWLRSLGRKKSSSGAHVPAQASLLMPPLPSVRRGMGEIRARLAKSLGLALLLGRASWHEEARLPQLLPQVLAPLAAGKGELISELHPKQRRSC